MIIEGQLQVFQRFSSSELARKTGESCFMALSCYGNGGNTEIVARSNAECLDLSSYYCVLQHTAVLATAMCCQDYTCYFRFSGTRTIFELKCDKF
jgi:hypothetical protein